MLHGMGRSVAVRRGGATYHLGQQEDDGRPLLGSAGEPPGNEPTPCAAAPPLPCPTNTKVERFLEVQQIAVSCLKHDGESPDVNATTEYCSAALPELGQRAEHLGENLFRQINSQGRISHTLRV